MAGNLLLGRLYESDHSHDSDEVIGFVSEFIEDIRNRDDIILPEDTEDLILEIEDSLDDYLGVESEVYEQTKKTVVRGGKKVRKLICKAGYKASGNKCVKMSAKELMTRGKAAKKGARKAKSKKAQASMKRKKSMKLKGGR